MIRAVAVTVTTSMLVVACGKRGPPLPPLVKLPQAPAELTVERRGFDVAIRFVVPSQNTDGTRPANVARVEVYAFTGPGTVTDAQVIEYGTRVAQLDVKAPRDPNLTTGPDQPAEEPDLRGEGVDQNATVELAERLGPEALTPVVIKERPGRGAAAAGDASPRPLTAPLSVPSRLYVAVGVSTGGRRGPLSRRLSVPLVPPPPPPAGVEVEYDETAVTVTWAPSPASAPIQEAATEGLLPARYFGIQPATLAYHVYEVPRLDDRSQVAPGASAVRLTKSPVTARRFEDTRMTWGAVRCYQVRTIAGVAGLSLESDPTLPECRELVDTFPPAAPKGLRAVGTGGAIGLIWEPNGEKDLAGYVVLRGDALDGELQPVTPAPIGTTSFSDAVPPGARRVYAIQAVDQAGNPSPSSVRVEETAR